jgi:hypothetical protein
MIVLLASKNNRPIVCGGIIKYWQGCYEGWVIASHHINKYPIETARTIKKYTNYLIKKTTSIVCKQQYYIALMMVIDLQNF